MPSRKIISPSHILFSPSQNIFSSRAKIGWQERQDGDSTPATRYQMKHNKLDNGDRSVGSFGENTGFCVNLGATSHGYSEQKSLPRVILTTKGRKNLNA